MCPLGTWFWGDDGGAGVAVELDDPEGLFQL